MSCFRPLDAWRLLTARSEKGRGVYVFSRPAGPAEAVRLPCGRCIGCRIEKSREWALRCIHEASLHELNCFVTLTYDDEQLPPLGSLVKADHQKFLKRLRKRFPAQNIRYFLCGEYGEALQRPHYHALLFGFDFLDKVQWCQSNGNQIWRSATLESLWKHGYSWIGSVTWSSAAYVARYCVKKVTGDRAYERYVKDVDVETGEISMLEPEYIVMSRRPGIGREWYRKFKSDCRKGFLTAEEGAVFAVPGYYARIMELEDAELHTRLQRERKEVAKGKIVERKRLVSKERHAKCIVERLKRSI